jgi:hypothetical protein
LQGVSGESSSSLGISGTQRKNLTISGGFQSCAFLCVSARGLKKPQRKGRGFRNCEASISMARKLNGRPHVPVSMEFTHTQKKENKSILGNNFLFLPQRQAIVI